MSPSTGEEGRPRRSSPAKSRNRLTPTIISQRMTSCALPKTEPVGDALQSTVLQPIDEMMMMILMMILMMMIVN